MRERSSGSDSLGSVGSTLSGRPASFCKPVRGSSNAGMHVIGREAKLCAVPSAKRSASAISALRGFSMLGDQVGILPDRHAVLAPVKSERPARQAFARIPFALPVMQEAARRETRAQFSDQIVGKRRAWSDRPRRYSIPAIPDRRRRRRSARRPWSAARHPSCRSASTCSPSLSSRAQDLIGERPRDPRRLADPLDAHLEGEVDIGKRPRCRRSAPPSDNAAWRRRGYAPRRSACPR